MKHFLLLLGLISFSISAKVKHTVRGDVLKLLPAEFSLLTLKSSKDEIEKVFKTKIKSKDEDAIYLQYFSPKDDVTIGVKKDHFQYLYLVVPQETREKTKGLFRRVYSDLSTKEKSKIEMSLKSSEHNAGGTITIDVPGENLKLEFINNESKTLRSVIIWPMNGERP